MLKVFKIVSMTFLFIIFGFSYGTMAEEITNYNDLIENGKALDGKELTLKGEAIGEPMKRGDYSWVNISDGSTAMGIWLKNSDAQRINLYGNNKAKGDTVSIIGIFNRSCAEHGGDMEVHALSISIVEKGNINEISISHKKINLAIILSIITAILSLAYLKKHYKNIKPLLR